MKNSIFKMLRFLLGFLVIPTSYGIESSPPCVTITQKGYQDSWRLVVIKITTTCGEQEKATLPLDPPTDDLSCTKCTNLLIIKQIQGTSIPPTSFGHYNFTTILYLENLEIESVLPGAFESMDSLRHLYLKGNRIKSIPIGVLNSAGNLETIDLSMNQIHSLKEIFLDGLTVITSVNLSMNFLTVIETNPNWNNITHLDLSHNKIKDINLKDLPSKLKVLNVSSNSLNSFDVRKNFTILDLANNFLISFNFNWINYTMDRLSLRNNKIMSVIGTYCHIKDIDLSSNNLDSVPCVCHQNSSQVERLDLSNNVITYVMPQTISELTNLKELHLECNRIKVIKIGTFASLQKLVYLNISHNNIEIFEVGSIDNIKNVEVFDVSYNKVKQLTRYIMHTFANLKHLHLEYNNITYINGTNLNEDLPAIWDINLVGNNLSCHNLWDILRIFNKRPVHFPTGPFKNVTNVHGMRCYFPPNATEDDYGASVGELEVNKGIADFFNNDYRESNFYKFLEEVKDANSLVYNETQKIKEAVGKMSRPQSKTPDSLVIHKSSSGFSGYLLTVIFFLLAIMCLIGLLAFVLLKKFRPRTEDSQRLL